MDPEELLAMGGVRVQGPNGPIITTPSQAARHGLQPLAAEPAPDPAPSAPQSSGMFAGMTTPNLEPVVERPTVEQAARVQSQTTPVAPGQIETVGGFTMGTSGRDAAPVNLGPSAAIASQNDAATAQARETFRSAPTQQAPGANYQQLAEATAGGDRNAHALLLQLQRNGDAEAGRALEDLQAYVDAGLMRAPGTGRGRGGPRVTQTETTTFTGTGRAPTEEETAGLAAAGEDAAVADAQYREGLALQNEAETSALIGEADALDRAAQEGEAFRARQQRQQQAQQAELARRERAVDSLLREVGETRIDSNRMFGKGETRNRAFAGVAIALSALGDGITGGDGGMSTAMTIINNVIEGDMGSQIANLENKHRTIAGKRNALADMRDRFGDDNTAQAALQAAMYQDVARHVRGLQARAQAPAQQAQLQQLLAQLDAQVAENKRQSLVSSLGVTESVQETQRRRGGGGGGRARSFTAGMRADPEPGEIASGDRASFTEQDTENRLALDTVDSAISQLGRTALTGIDARLTPDMFAGANARELDRLLRQAALPAVQEAFGAANPAQVDDMAQTLGLDRGLTRSEIYRSLLRERERLIERSRGARLSVDESVVQENRARAPGVRSDVMLEDPGSSGLLDPRGRVVISGGRR